MNIIEARLEHIKPYEKNPRHKRDIKKVAQSIKEFGWQQPIVVDKGFVIILTTDLITFVTDLKILPIPIMVFPT